MTGGKEYIVYVYRRHRTKTQLDNQRQRICGGASGVIRISLSPVRRALLGVVEEERGAHA